MSDDPKALNEDTMAAFASYFSATTALIEACDWDEDKALEVFEAVANGLEDIYEYSLYDKSIAKDTAELENLLKLNVTVDGETLTDDQLGAVINLIAVRSTFDKQAEEKKKHLN